MNIVEARGRDAWLDLREEWENLLARCEAATIYQTWEWNEAWWRAFGRSRPLRILCVRDRGELVGIAPLYVSRHLGTPLRRLAFVGTGASDYLDVLTPASHAPQVGHAVLDHLMATGGFDLADLQQLSPSSALRQAACEWIDASEPMAHAALVPQEPCPYLGLPSDWPEFAARLGKKMRSNTAYYDRLFHRTFGDGELRVARADELADGMTSLFDLHQRRWNARLLPGVLGGAKAQAFHRTVAQRFQERGWLRLHLAQAEQGTVAALYCFSFRRRYYYYLGGFAPEMARYSLGTVLTARAIQQAIDEGCEEFDFLRGAEEYKYRWLPVERVNHRLLTTRKSGLRSQAMLRLNGLEQYVEKRAKKFAETRGRKQLR